MKLALNTKLVYPPIEQEFFLSQVKKMNLPFGMKELRLVENDTYAFYMRFTKSLVSIKGLIRFSSEKTEFFLSDDDSIKTGLYVGLILGFIGTVLAISIYGRILEGFLFFFAPSLAIYLIQIINFQFDAWLVRFFFNRIFQMQKNRI